MKKIIVRRKKDAPPILRNNGKNKNKPHIHSLAAVFKNYNDALSRADALFDVFSPERLQAQQVALDRLKERLEQLNIINIDWSQAYNNVVKYAEPRELVA